MFDVSETREELPILAFTHYQRMAFMREQDVPLYPLNLRFFYTITGVFESFSFLSICDLKER